MRLNPSVNTHRLQTVWKRAHLYTHTRTHTHCKKGEKSTLLKNLSSRNATQCRWDSSTFILLWQIQEEASLAPKAAPPTLLPLALGSWDWLQARPFPQQPGVPSLQPNSVMIPWASLPAVSQPTLADAERITGQRGGFYPLVQRLRSWGWIFRGRINRQAAWAPSGSLGIS